MAAGESKEGVKLLHTADWQLGKRFGRARSETVRERLRTMRFQALERIAALAREHRVDAVVVAGDVFDEAHPSAGVLQRTADALAALPCPLLLLPGNHDPARGGEEDGPLRRLAALRAGAAGSSPTVVFDEPRRYEGVVSGVVFWAAPVGPAQQGDPTDWVAEAALPEADGRLHVLVAHGGERGMLAALDGGEGDPLSPALDVRRFFEPPFSGRFAYAALGDWHSPLQVPGTGGRARYSGTPERCSWKERDPGHVLLVSLPRGEVEAVPVGRGRWLRLPREGSWRLQDEQDLARLRAEVEGLRGLSETWLRLSLGGAPSFEVYEALRSWLLDLSGRCLQLDVDESALRPAPGEEVASSLRADPLVGPVYEGLVAGLEETERLHGEDAFGPPEPDEVSGFASWVLGGGLEEATRPSEGEVEREALRELADLWTLAGQGE